MWNLIKKDYIALFTKKMEVILFTLSLPVIMLLISFEEKWVYFIGVLCIYYLTLGLYSETDTDFLIYSMPIKKYKVVLSRYIIFFINYLIISSYIYLTSSILLKLNFIDRIQYLNIDFFKLILFFSMIAVSVALPFVFRLRYEIGMRFTNVVLIFLINLSTNYLFHRSYDPTVDRVDLVNNTTFIARVIITMIISILISLYGYKKKEF